MGDVPSPDVRFHAVLGRYRDAASQDRARHIPTAGAGRHSQCASSEPRVGRLAATLFYYVVKSEVPPAIS